MTAKCGAGSKTWVALKHVAFASTPLRPNDTPQFLNLSFAKMISISLLYIDV